MAPSPDWRLLPVVPAADTVIAGHALDPSDVVCTRAGPSAGFGATDAEGRLMLADALARAGGAWPALILVVASLTGAARIAPGAVLPALAGRHEALAAGRPAAAHRGGDPTARRPQRAPRRRLLRASLANSAEVGKGPVAGAILGARPLKRFVPACTASPHLDLSAPPVEMRPGRPRGGLAPGLFAALGLPEARVG